MKPSATLLLLILAGCGRGGAPEGQPTGANQAAAPLPARIAGDDGKAECALAGAAAFERICTIERSDSPDGRVLTLRDPDGGFRRLLVTRDGRGVIAADGAESARVTVISPERIEVAIGRDRYRLPASVRS
ncbi:MAG: hypothetical protein JWP15_208 [Alphaproteobacteria bacterium]|nr:hypothetical protein [Alphaproteobacteria bacterium]